jgi:hypothetical protein
MVKVYMVRRLPGRVALPAFLVLLATAVCRPPGVISRPPVEQVVLERRQQGLQTLIAAAQQGRLIPFDQVLVVVSQELVQGLIQATLPLEQVLAERYRVRVESARVEFEDGFALVQLRGRASLVDDAETSAEIDVYGGIDIVDLDPQTGVLRGRVTILALETQRVKLIGMSAPVRQLVSDLGREQLKVFEPLLNSIEIPVRLEQELQIPAFDQSGVKIPAASLPLAAGVVDVKAFRGRLWICATAQTGATPGGPR